MRIAILFKDSLKDRKGLLNAVLNRANALIKQDSNNQVDLFCIHFYYNHISCILNGTSYNSQFEEDATLDGLHIRWLWVKVGLWDVLRHKILRTSLHDMDKRSLVRVANHFDNYDILSAHSLIAGIAAKAIAEKQKRPYFVTWHGTDIHTAPFLDKEVFVMTKDLLCNATSSFFVSKALKNQAQAICSQFDGEVLYNGVSENFYRYDDVTRKQLRNCYNLHDEKVVAFCGNVIDVKNVDVLPELFEKIESQYKGNLTFWIIGDGNKRSTLQSRMEKSNIKFWGNVSADKMPDMMNCVDVLVLPSKNEALGLVTLEAMACGANVVGSKVGGIPEAIGNENAFGLDESFVDNAAWRVIEMLNGNVKQDLNPCFDWKRTAEKEMSIFKTVIR